MLPITSFKVIAPILLQILLGARPCHVSERFSTGRHGTQHGSLRATSDALVVLSSCRIDISPSPALGDQCVELILIFVYIFFKFAWAYRLFNYVYILLGALPPAYKRDTAEAEAHVIRTARLFEAGGRHLPRLAILDGSSARGSC